jgi:hypothetical protein
VVVYSVLASEGIDYSAPSVFVAVPEGYEHELTSTVNPQTSNDAMHFPGMPATDGRIRVNVSMLDYDRGPLRLSVAVNLEVTVFSSAEDVLTEGWYGHSQACHTDAEACFDWVDEYGIEHDQFCNGVICRTRPRTAEVCGAGLPASSVCLSDCECAGDMYCSVDVGCTNGESETCGDGIDNDNDGEVDEADCVWPDLCGDGIDNDNDGEVDEADCTAVELCGDSIDNDTDEQVDEADCTEPAPELCGDGIDNDFDGEVDEVGCFDLADSDL